MQRLVTTEAEGHACPALSDRTSSAVWLDQPPRGGCAASLRDVAAEENLLKAWHRVRQNNGAAGVDGVTIADLEPQFPGLTGQLPHLLLNARYRPKPVLRVEIPKPSGGTRKLGVPTVIDRIVQQAVLQVLQPLFEPGFSSHSFAYRPGRGPLDAVRHIQRRLSMRSGWVLHFDVADFFDSVPHDRVLAAISARITDPALLALIQDTLSCGVCEKGLGVPTFQGVAQGSPLSPLLANAVLDALDKWLEQRGAVFARYADDCAVLVDSAAEGQRLRVELAKFLSTLSLRLNEEKTSLSPAHQAEFLGFSFAEGRAGRCRRIISPASLADFARGVGERVSERSAAEFDERIRAIVTLLDSWLGYYGATEDPRQIETIIAQAEDALRLSEWRRWGSPAVRHRFLVARTVPDELARQAANAPEESPVVLAALRQAFPPAFFQTRGLSRTASRTAPLPRCLDYSGRLRSVPETGDKLGAVWPPTRATERTWQLLRSRWIDVGLQLERSGWALLPRLVSLSFHVRGHQIVIHW